jgi:hypothetical protein
MKRILGIILVCLMLLGLLSSCSKQICPAYSFEDNTEQASENS